MLRIDIDEASSQLSQLVERALQGECVVISLRGEPAVELVPVGPSSRQRKPGRLTGQISMAPDSDVTPKEITSEFQDRNEAPEIIPE